MIIKATVREQKSNLGTDKFGRITSKELAPFIGKDVEIEIKEINN